MINPKVLAAIVGVRGPRKDFMLGFLAGVMVGSGTVSLVGCRGKLVIDRAEMEFVEAQKRAAEKSSAVADVPTDNPDAKR